METLPAKRKILTRGVCFVKLFKKKNKQQKKNEENKHQLNFRYETFT